MFFNEPKPYGFWPAKNCVVGSTGQRNILIKGISRRLEAKRFSGPRIEPPGNLIKVILGVDG